MTKRLTALTLSALIVVSAVAPMLTMTGVAAAAGNTSSGGSGVALADVTGHVGYDVPTEDVVLYGADRQPSFIVEYSDGEFDKLDAWAAASDARSVEEHHNTSNTAVVSAPVTAVAHSSVDELTDSVMGSEDLSDRSYIQAVYLNLRVDTPRPVDIKAEDRVSANLSSIQQLAVTVSGGETGTGVAYSDEINESTLGNATDIVGADAVSADGSGARICVIDTGVNTAGGDLYGNRITAAKNTITGETGVANVSDGVGHGSWVASAIAANATGTKFDGVAPDAELIVVKALNSDGGSLADVREGIRYCGRQDADVISMSLGSKLYSEALTTTIRETVENSPVRAVVVAAGNSRMTTRWVSTPADAPADAVVAVAATDAEPASSAKSAYFSSVGPDLAVKDLSGGKTLGERPDVSAPGTEITAQVASEDGTVTTSTLSGTSMSTPIVSGVAALVIDAHPDVTGPELRERLQRGAEPILHAGITEVGHGMIDAENAVSGSYPDTSQKEARTDKARARDAANRAMGGYGESLFPSRALAKATSWVPVVAA